MIGRRGQALALALGLGMVAVAPAAAQEAAKLSDQVIDQLATALARAADRSSQRPVAYFAAEPPAQVRSYLEGQGVDVAVLGASPAAAVAVPAPAAAAPASAPAIPAASAPVLAPAAPYAVVNMGGADTKQLIQDLLVAVREIAAALPAGGPVAVEGFTVDLPAGTVQFRLR
jgi:hypothetical protein